MADNVAKSLANAAARAREIQQSISNAAQTLKEKRDQTMTTNQSQTSGGKG